MVHQQAYFFPGGGRQEAIDALFEGIYHSGVVLLLVGAAGSGRTALIERFQAEVDPQVLAVSVVAGDILMSPGQLLASMSGGLGYPVVGNPADSLWRAVADIRSHERGVAFVIDDAHELGSEARAEAIRFAREADVALILVGDESLAPVMDPDVSFELIALRAFDEEESEAFVAGWLNVDDEDELPSHRVVARLHRHSAGLPGRLAGLLGSGAAAREPLLANGIPPWHVLLGFAALAFLALVIGFVLLASPSAEVSAPMEVSVALPHPRVPGAADAVARERAVSAAVPQPMNAKPYVPPAQASDAPEDGVSAQALPAVAEEASRGDAIVITAVPGARLSAVPATASTPPGRARYSVDEQALLAEARSRYTVQLFASFNEQAVVQFRDRHAGTEIRLFRTVREDLPWYVAVTGGFRNRDDARSGISRLPLDLQALKPWARSLQGIQDELRRRKD